MHSLLVQLLPTRQGSRFVILPAGEKAVQLSSCGSRHQEGKAPPPGLHIKSGMTDWALACTQYRAGCKARRISFGV